MTTFEYQAKIHQSEARFRLVNGGRRIGKSVIGGRETVAQAVVPESYIWILGPTMDLAEKEFRVAWKKIVDEQFIPVRRKSERELFLQLENGSVIECRTEENPDQLIGEGLDLVVLAEAARLKHRTWDQYIRPSLADRKGKALFTSTPRGFNWFWEFWKYGQVDQPEYDPDWESWTVPSRMNPILGEAEIAMAMKTSTPEAFAQEWEAKFIAYGGLVYPEFSQDLHVRSHTFDDLTKPYLWIDPGVTAPYCVLLVQITPDEFVNVIDEIYITGHTTDRVINIAEEKWGPYILRNGHPREDLEVIIDKAAREAAATWRLRGYSAWGEKPKIKQGIEVHHMMLRDPFLSDEDNIVPRITFDPRCNNAIKEHGLYHYPDESRKRIFTNASELPVDVDNHAMDALRYGYFNVFPELFNEQARGDDLITVPLEDLIDTQRISLGDY